MFKINTNPHALTHPRCAGPWADAIRKAHGTVCPLLKGQGSATGASRSPNERLWWQTGHWSSGSAASGHDKLYTLLPQCLYLIRVSSMTEVVLPEDGLQACWCSTAITWYGVGDMLIVENTFTCPQKSYFPVLCSCVMFSPVCPSMVSFLPFCVHHYTQDVWHVDLTKQPFARDLEY